MDYSISLLTVLPCPSINHFLHSFYSNFKIWCRICHFFTQTLRLLPVSLWEKLKSYTSIDLTCSYLSELISFCPPCCVSRCPPRCVTNTPGIFLPQGLCIFSCARNVPQITTWLLSLLPSGLFSKSPYHQQFIPYSIYWEMVECDG